MSLSSRFSRRTVFFLLGMLTGVCAAQQSTLQFGNTPAVELTGARVTGFVTGQFQDPPNLTDILYIEAPAVSGTTSSVTVGLLLNNQGFYNPGLGQIDFTGVLGVSAAVADFNNDHKADFAFALSQPQGSTAPNFCVYYGTGATAKGQNPNYNAGVFTNAYPPTGGTAGCMTIPIQGSKLNGLAPLPANLSYIAALPLKTAGGTQQVVVEDSANNYLYVLANNGTTGLNGKLPGWSVAATIAIPAADGAGPIYVGDFNNDGNTDFIINGQTGNSASVWFGNGSGSFLVPTPQNRYAYNIHSMLIEDMDGNGIPDMVVEGANGVIEIFKGAADGTFAAASEGGTAAGVDGFSGNGGHLAVIAPNVPGAANLEILTTTPIGLSVLQHAPGNLTYTLKAIYNIGPGRSSYALASFFDDGTLDFAVDSAEGVAIITADPNGDGGFQTLNAYAALQPALGSVVGKFRNAAPGGRYDVVVPTGALQAQLLTGTGAGAFSALGSPTNLSGGPSGIPANLWSNLMPGDFNGDGKLDIAYSLTGLPLPAPGSGSGLYIQYGNGDGTFAAPVAVSPSQVGAPGGNSFYGESASGFFNSDSITDIANADANYDDTLLGLSANSFKLGLNVPASNPAFDQVAVGYFTLNRGLQQDLVFQRGASFIPYANKQDGTGTNFTAMPALTGAASPLTPATVLLTDVDGDGYGDVVAVYYNIAANPVGAGPVSPYQVYIWWGNGDGTFATPTVLSMSRNYYLGAVADMNSDKLPDLVLSDGSLISILYNQGNRSFGTISPTTGLYTSEQHFLAGQGINSLTLADVNGDGKPDLIVANGGVTLANPLVGAIPGTFSLATNPDVNTGGITVLMNNIATQPVTGKLVAVADPAIYGTSFNLVATLVPTTGVPLPTGTVQFSIDGTAVGTPVAVAPATINSTATYSVPVGNIYAAGVVHTLGAIYSGDANNTTVTLAGTENISGGPTTTTIYLCVGPTANCPSLGYIFPPFASTLQMYYGQTWNGTWQVTDTDNGPLPGNFELFDVYNGVSGPPLCDVPNSTVSPCPPAVGVTVGTSVGVNVITGVYTGDSTHTSSTSTPVTITVLPDTTTATLTGAPNPSPQGQPVTFTATVTGNIVAPTGPVQFVETFPPATTAVPLGMANLVPGPGLSSTAIFTISTLPVGADSIQASYAATTDFNGALSPVFVETITPPISGSFTVSATPNPVTVLVGYSQGITITVSALNGFSQNVTLSCGNLPTETTCSFANPTTSGGSGTTTLFVTTTAPHSCGTTTPYFNGSNGRGGLAPLALPALAGLVAMFFPGRRRWLRALLVVIVAAGATQITGCGNCTDLGTRPNTYTIQVTGTAAGTGEVASQTITLNVII